MTRHRHTSVARTLISEQKFHTDSLSMSVMKSTTVIIFLIFPAGMWAIPPANIEFISAGRIYPESSLAHILIPIELDDIFTAAVQVVSSTLATVTNLNKF